MGLTRAAFTGGEPVAKYLNAFDVDLFLSATEEDVQAAVESQVASGLIYDGPMRNAGQPLEQIRRLPPLLPLHVYLAETHVEVSVLGQLRGLPERIDPSRRLFVRVRAMDLSTGNATVMDFPLNPELVNRD